MKNTKKGFTLAELLLGIAILIVIVGLTIPVVKKILPDTDKENVKRAYYQLGVIIKSLTSDPYLYPTGRFDSPRAYKNQQTGVKYKRSEKFTKAFISRLNVLGVEEGIVINNYNVSGYTDKDLTIKNGDGINKDLKTCALTSNRVYYCLPTLTVEEAETSDTRDIFYTNTTGTPNRSGHILISVFFERNDDGTFDAKKGYYFAVSNTGRLHLMPTDSVTCYGKNVSQAGDSCQCFSQNGNKYLFNESTYNEYNQCKLYEYLSKIK